MTIAYYVSTHVRVIQGLRGGPAKPGTFPELRDPGARGPRFAARAAPRDDIRDPPALQPRAGPVTGARTTKRTVQRLPPSKKMKFAFDSFEKLVGS